MPEETHPQDQWAVTRGNAVLDVLFTVHLPVRKWEEGLMQPTPRTVDSE